MDTSYDPRLRAQVTRDDRRKVLHIRLSPVDRYGEEAIPRVAANAYLREVADVLDLSTDQLERLDTRVDAYTPAELGVEYRLDEEKQLFDSTTVGYAQTYLNLPVWRRGISVKVKHAPNRVVSVTNNSEDGLKGELPAGEAVARYRSMFDAARVQRAIARRKLAMHDETEEGDETAWFVREIVGADDQEEGKRSRPMTLLNGRFVVYKYDPDKRFQGQAEPPEPDREAASLEDGASPPYPPIPDVSTEIEPGRAYVAAELIFRYDMPRYGELVWLALVEVETGSVLYIECMTCGVNAMVFRRDPNVSSGDLTVTSAASNSVLENHDSDETLNALDAPVNGVQSLTGTYVTIVEEESPTVAAPTQGSGVDFDYAPRTNDFAAANAYYHQTELFRTIESLGFTISTYFDGTTFPIPVDHRGLGEEINAHWAPNGTGGTDHMCYGLCDTTNTAEPLGRAVDPWVHWHEMGGHGTLGDHVGQGMLGFAHSAGDGLAALQMDPDSALRAGSERFRYAPFRPFTGRRFDRTWKWGGPEDEGAVRYNAEQILATCHFRLYRSIGGDHVHAARRHLASRAVTYLILRTIAGLTPGTNPGSAQVWADEMQDTDLLDWTSEGLAGGAYNKVVRWAFEEQGAYGGTPPNVDLYIDDGRGGEYPFQGVHWHNTSMWNRNRPDGGTTHENAIESATNYMYVKIKNRGTQNASNVTVKGYHCLPGAGVTWPTDFTTMTPAAGLNVATVAANNGGEVTVGPFEWIPSYNAYGHDCVLMIVSNAEDPSNVDHFTGSETIEEWRLVPNDNNVGQRNVSIVPGGNGVELMEALDGATFFAGNTFNRPAVMHFEVRMPDVLAEKGWRLEFGDFERFKLGPREKQAVPLKLVPGDDFTPDELAGGKELDIEVDLFADGMILGGMKYRVDPELREPSGGKKGDRSRCREAVQALLECLEAPHGDRIEDVHVREVRGATVSIDVELGRKGG